MTLRDHGLWGGATDFSGDAAPGLAEACKRAGLGWEVEARPLLIEARTAPDGYARVDGYAAVRRTDDAVLGYLRNTSTNVINLVDFAPLVDTLTLTKLADLIAVGRYTTRGEVRYYLALRRRDPAIYVGGELCWSTFIIATCYGSRRFGAYGWFAAVRVRDGAFLQYPLPRVDTRWRLGGGHKPLRLPTPDNLMRQWTICDDTLGTVSTYLRDAPISPVMAREAIYGASKKNRWYPPRRCWDRYVAQGWDNRWGILSVVAEDYASKTYESSDSERLGHELENRPADARYALYKLLIN